MPQSALIAMMIPATMSPITGPGNSYFAACDALSRQAAAMALTALWQGALVACGLAICLRLLPRTSAEHRFALWASALVTLVGLPFLAFVAGAPSALQSATSPAGPGGSVGPLLNPMFWIDTRWSLPITALWSVATLYRACDLALHSLKLRKLWRDAVPVDPRSNLGALIAAANPVSKRGPVEVCTTTMLQRPSVIGFFKPRILIPDWLLARLTHSELEQIVLHEVEHLRRYDDWSNLFQKLCLVLFPLNPALVFIERRLCREREMACDDGVIRITRAPRAYAACLTSLAERGLQRSVEALSLGAWQRRPELVHRVHSILHRKHTLGPLGTRALLGALGCGLLVGSIELARCPQLIAFVPPQNHDLKSTSAKLSVHSDHQLGSAQLMSASYGITRTAPTRKSSTGSSATRADTLLPTDRQKQTDNRLESANPMVTPEEVELIRRTQPYATDRNAPRPVLLKAEMPGSQPTSAEPQQWLVLTAWEQIESPNQNAGLTASGLTADYQTAAPDESAGSSTTARSTSVPSSAPSRTMPTSQITITRLILKIYPSASFSREPALVPMRDGWFVIQL